MSDKPSCEFCGEFGTIPAARGVRINGRPACHECFAAYKRRLKPRRGVYRHAAINLAPVKRVASAAGQRDLFAEVAP